MLRCIPATSAPWALFSVPPLFFIPKALTTPCDQRLFRRVVWGEVGDIPYRNSLIGIVANLGSKRANGPSLASSHFRGSVTSAMKTA